ncbi:MAG TPA: hypothetical protein VHN15_06695 [Thermoanaerobaculia bacterium]|nr:hypothetical protein [Thermoanaerobaculia bacterium]
MRRAMRTTLSLAVAGLGLLLGTAPVGAATCALDNLPAATLLLPYFEVDLANPQGRTTLFSVNNADDQAVLAHVVLWTDLAVPTLAFDVYLTGYDIQTVNLRDVFEGRLPRTADEPNDLADLISPGGPLSWEAAHPGCVGVLPPPPVPASLLEHVRAAHTGRASPILPGACAGIAHGDQVARGYVTIDVVRTCTQLVPGSPGYFGPNGIAGTANVLWGDSYHVDPAGRFAHGENLVRIEADPAAFGPGDMTFYGRYVGYSGADGREPLATTWATRFLRGGAFSGGTDLVIWRDPGRPAEMFACGAEPSWQPLFQGRVTSFDEEESIEEYGGGFFLTPVPPNFGRPFAFAAGRVKLEDFNLLTSHDFGWFFLDLAQSEREAARAQSWVGTVFSAEGVFSAGLKATALDSSCSPSRCLRGEPAEIGRVCLLGPVRRDQPLTFAVYPKGCFSSSCTLTTHVDCEAVRDGNEVFLDALICLQTNVGTNPCTPDCSGGDRALCGLSAVGQSGGGSYVARAGDLRLPFTVPMQVPEGGLCVGDPF